VTVPAWAESPVEAAALDAATAMLERLGRVDPCSWGGGAPPPRNAPPAAALSAAGTQAAWHAALDGMVPEDFARRVPGAPPGRVLIIASANVFTAPLEWMLHLAARGVDVRVKPARGQLEAVQAMAVAVDPAGRRLQVTPWTGGEDLEAEARAMRDVDAVIAFGTAEGLAAIGARVPAGVRYLPFGPRFGVAMLGAPSTAHAEAVAWDHVLHDGRGCMSPAAVFVEDADPTSFRDALADLAARVPAGPLTPAEARARRERVASARVHGRALEAGDGVVLVLPATRFSPVALPRTLVLHPVTGPAEVGAALAAHAPRLGTVAASEGYATLARTFGGTVRVCDPGAMQRPPTCRLHDGVDVLGALWRP
jgi:hypothetical protein